MEINKGHPPHDRNVIANTQEGLQKMIKLPTVIGITMCLFLNFGFLANGMSSADEVKLNQTTTGDKSPVVNAGRDATINYNDDIEGRIIDKLNEIARKCNDQRVKLEDIKPELEALVLFKTRALPYIIRFASNYMDLNINKYDPDFLLKYRTKLIQIKLFDFLFYVIQKIYSSNSDARNFLSNLYINTYVSSDKEKDALILGYYLWRFPQQETKEILFKWLKEIPVIEWDPLKKVLLRTYLNTNFTERYFFRPSNNNKEQTEFKKETYDLTETYLSALGLEGIQNADIFIKHLSEFLYETLEDKDTEIGTRSLNLPDIREILRNTRGIYLYGFDFYDLGLYNLMLDDILLGKTFFEKAFIANIIAIKSTFLECNFKNALIRGGWFDSTNFIGVNLEGLTINEGVAFGRSGFSESIFNASDFSNATFVSVDFIDTNFESCVFKNSKLTFRECLLLNVKFNNCEPKRIFFDDVIVDEQTLNNIFKLPGFKKSDYIIKEVSKNLKDTSNSLSMIRINMGLSTFQKRGDIYNHAKAIIAEHKMFRIRSNDEESKLSPAKRYAYFKSIIKKCGEIYPAEKSDFEKASLMLDKFFESKKEFSGVLTNPIVSSLITELTPEVDDHMKIEKDCQYICDKMKRGKFGIIDR